MNLGFWPGLLVPAPEPPDDGPMSIIAKADAVDRTSEDTAIDKDTVLLRDFLFIFSSISSGVNTNLLFHGGAEENTPGALGAGLLRQELIFLDRGLDNDRIVRSRPPSISQSRLHAYKNPLFAPGRAFCKQPGHL